MSGLFARSIVILALAFSSASTVSAESYPDRPVHMVVPYAAGGSGDLIARLLGQRLSPKWKNEIVVDDRPGGNGVIGTDFANRATPDGYTLYMAATAGPLTGGPFVGRASYDWKNDFQPIALAAVGYQVLVVNPNFPAKTLQDFIAKVKASPGRYNIASIGVGSAPHLAAELFQFQTGTQMVHVPFNGSAAQAITNLIGGDVNAFIVGTSTVVPMIQAGQLRALAVTAQQRLDSLPDVPTFQEQGVDFNYNLWFAVLGQRAMPPEIAKKLREAIGDTATDSVYQQALRSRGFDTKAASADAVGKLLDDDARLNLQIAAKIGVR